MFWRKKRHSSSLTYTNVNKQIALIDFNYWDNPKAIVSGSTEYHLMEEYNSDVHDGIIKKIIANIKEFMSSKFSQDDRLYISFDITDKYETSSGWEYDIFSLDVKFEDLKAKSAKELLDFIEEQLSTYFTCEYELVKSERSTREE